MRRSLRIILGLTVAAWFLIAWSGQGLAAEEKGEGLAGIDLKVGSEPIRVSAKTLVWDHKEHKATFRYEVVARQSDLTIHCDDLTIYFNQNDSELKYFVLIIFNCYYPLMT